MHGCLIHFIQLYLLRSTSTNDIMELLFQLYVQPSKMQGIFYFSKSRSEYINSISIVFICFDFFLTSFWVLAHIFGSCVQLAGLYLDDAIFRLGCVPFYIRLSSSAFAALCSRPAQKSRWVFQKRGNCHRKEDNLNELHKYRALYLIVAIKSHDQREYDVDEM